MDQDRGSLIKMKDGGGGGKQVTQRQSLTTSHKQTDA